MDNEMARNYDEFLNGLQCAINDGVDGKMIETLLPSSWESYHKHLEKPAIVLNVKDYDLPWGDPSLEYEIEDFYHEWKEEFSKFGLDLIVTGRSGGYCGFELQNFLDYAVEINEEGAKEFFRDIQPELGFYADEDDDESDEYFNQGYDLPFEDDRNIAKLFKVSDEIRKTMEYFESVAEDTRDQWKNDYIPSFEEDDE